MSQENVELIRTWYLQFPALNSEALDFMYEQVWDSAIDWRAMAGAPDDLGPIEGRDAMRRYNEELLEIFEDIVGVETELRFAILCVLRDGRIVRGREYATKEEALEAAGLSEQDAHADS
jgi:hypothetical protein